MIRCLSCNTTLESTYRHDFKQCKCPNEAMVDGGLDYCRYGAHDMTKVEIWNSEQQKFIPALRQLKEQIKEIATGD